MPAHSTTPMVTAMVTDLRKERRHSCAMPGLLKLMRPEDTFTPLRLPVIILDISGGGALIRLHPNALKMSPTELRQRSFSLKVANDSLPPVRGFVVWTHRTEEMCLLGLQFHKPCDGVGEMAARGAIGREESSQGVPSVPLLYPYKTHCEEPVLVLEGEAYRAQEVHVRNAAGDQFVVPVRNAFFRIELPLAENGENRFTLCAANSEARSADIEIGVHCSPEPDQRRLGPRASYRITRDPVDGGPSLGLSFSGNVPEAQEFMAVVRDMMLEAPHVRLEVRLSTGRDFDAARLKALSRKLQQFGL